MQVLVETGDARGFERIRMARAHLLQTYPHPTRPEELGKKKMEYASVMAPVCVLRCAAPRAEK